MDDKELLGLLRSDPDEGMKRLLAGYTGCVYSVVRAVLSGICDSSEIEDVVTDVFISFYTRLDSFRGEASIKTYLCRTAKHLANNCLRKRRDARSLDDEDLFSSLQTITILQTRSSRSSLFPRSLPRSSAWKSPTGRSSSANTTSGSPRAKLPRTCV